MKKILGLCKTLWDVLRESSDFMRLMKSLRKDQREMSRWIRGNKCEKIQGKGDKGVQLCKPAAGQYSYLAKLLV